MQAYSLTFYDAFFPPVWQVRRLQYCFPGKIPLLSYLIIPQSLHLNIPADPRTVPQVAAARPRHPPAFCRPHTHYNGCLPHARRYAPSAQDNLRMPFYPPQNPSDKYRRLQEVSMGAAYKICDTLHRYMLLPKGLLPQASRCETLFLSDT